MSCNAVGEWNKVWTPVINSDMTLKKKKNQLLSRFYLMFSSDWRTGEEAEWEKNVASYCVNN